MGVPLGFFDDYLYFYPDVVSAEQSDLEVDAIDKILAPLAGLRVLDVPCGPGRIAGRLAARGCEVIGIDKHPPMLGLAREQYPLVSFELGDMRSLPFEQEFDVIVHWGASFGYFDPQTNDRVLEQFAAALHPGGRLLLEVQNPWTLARRAERPGSTFSSVIERDGDLMVDRVRYDHASCFSHAERFVVRDGQQRKLEASIEHMPAPRLRGRLHRAGFGDIQLFGQGGASFDPLGPTLIALAAVGSESQPRRVPAVSLRPVNAQNVSAVCGLRPAPGQSRNGRSNAEALAEAHFDPAAWVRAVYADDEFTGLLILAGGTTNAEVELAHLLIAPERQRQGIGRAVIDALRDDLRTGHAARSVVTQDLDRDHGTRAFLRAAGFRADASQRFRLWL
jgi:SAM-dependent methyltransferase/GNAT superfamily N-acetyltransferase